MRGQIAVRRRLWVGALCGTLISGSTLVAASLAEPAAAAAKTTCAVGKIHAQRPTITQSLVRCTNAGAAGAHGTAVVNLNASRIKITWGTHGSSVLSFTRKPRPRPNKCPKATALSAFVGKVISGTGGALKRYPKGSTLSERLCINPTTFATTRYPSGAVTISPPVGPPTTTTSATTTSTTSTTASTTTTTTTTNPCPAGPIATQIEAVTGTNGNAWDVVTSAGGYTDSCRPTGTLDVGIAQGALANSGVSNPAGGHWWGVDTGEPVEFWVQICQLTHVCSVSGAGYSGDGTYQSSSS